MPFFTVIIPTYNRAALLREALDSVFAQDFADFEVIVVDDGSTDNTAAAAANYGNRIRFLRQSNQGPGAARNAGIREAQGEYVAFLDSDDLWFPWTLAVYRQILEKHESVSVILGRCFPFNSTGELEAIEPDSKAAFDLFGDFLQAAEQATIFGTNAATIRLQTLKECGGLEERLRAFEDQDLGLRLGIVSDFIKIDSPPTVGYRRTSPTDVSAVIPMGLRFLIQRERRGEYPGGEARKWERRNYISLSIRSVSVWLLREDKFRDAWSLYLDAFLWHVRLVRLKYLVGFPLLSIWQMICRGGHSKVKQRSLERPTGNTTRISNWRKGG